MLPEIEKTTELKEGITTAVIFQKGEIHSLPFVSGNETDYLKEKLAAVISYGHQVL